MFMHGGILHIAFNMWCLWDLVALAESLYGRVTYGAIYMHHRCWCWVGERGLESRSAKRRGFRSNFWLGRCADRILYLGEFSLPSIAIRGTLADHC